MFSIVPLVNAQPGLQRGDPASGLMIEAPIISHIKSNNSFKFNVHVYNATNGFPMNPSNNVGCFLHLYNPLEGGHLVESEMPFNANGIDYELNVEGGNFTLSGQYAVLMSCNNSFQGGFIEYGLDVLPSGHEYTEAQGTSVLGLIIILIFLSGALLYFGYKTESLPFKIFLIALGVLFALVLMGTSVVIIKQLLIVGAVLSGTFVSIYRLMLILVSMGGIGLILYLITMAVKGFAKMRGKEDDDD